MTEVKHTPGPWVVDPDSPTDISPADDLRLGIASISHADEAGGRWEFGEQSKANAKLIAAAPALLKSAIEVCEAWSKFIDSFDYVPGIGDTAENIEFQEMMRLRIAINEATQ